MRRPILLPILLALVTLVAPAADISIRGTGEGKTPISLSGIHTDGSQESRQFLQVLRADLNRSGWLTVIDAPNATLRVDGIVSGNGAIAPNLRIADARGTVTPWTRRDASSATRQCAHLASDEILLRTTGRKGMAAAPILLVGKRGNATDIYLCDADGQRLRNLTGEGALCLSPTWLPDRAGFLYTSFSRRFGAVYQASFQPNGSLRRTSLAAFPGLNNGGIVSPDGRLAAIVLSFTGNVELYVMNLATKKLTRLTRTPHANEASPDWSPDGRTIAYVSDEGRTPQVYLLSMGAKHGRRLIHGLQESVSPDWSPDGRLAFCGKSGGVYGIYVCGTDGRHALVSPADGANYEDPSWAPDGRHIVASRAVRGGRRSLVLLDSMGDPPVNLTPYDGEWYLPDWAK